uniref:Putative n-acetylglucosaminyltransferase complex n=1 Tax=Tabanus bromius TaxID=304241 RepID=A0A0K8TN76_TABBR
MPEHTPAPTPDRAVYGFALFLLFHTVFFLYILWAFIPSKFFEEMLGLTYLPDKYFALYIPILILCGVTFFAFFIYPSLNMAITPNICTSRTVRDTFSIYKCRFEDCEGRKCQDNISVNSSCEWDVNKFCKAHAFPRATYSVDDDLNEITNKCDCPDFKPCLLRKSPNHVKHLRNKSKIPTVSDLDIADVCKEIYST